MSMSSNLKSDSTSAVVLDVMVSNKGERFVKVEYLDGIARPDLVGKVSPWIDCLGDYMPGDSVLVEFAAEGDRRFNQVFFKPYIGCRHTPDEELGVIPRKAIKLNQTEKAHPHDYQS